MLLLFPFMDGKAETERLQNLPPVAQLVKGIGGMQALDGELPQVHR